MLDSLGSTLSRNTIDSFYTRSGIKPHEDSLTISQAVQCLEAELCRPASEKKRINFDDSAVDTSAPVTPSMFGAADNQLSLNLEKLDFSGPAGNIPAHDNTHIKKPSPPAPYSTEHTEQPLIDVALPVGIKPRFERQVSASSSDAEDSSGSGSSSPSSDDSFERVINVKSCPLCHRPRMNSKAEVDIVTHLAVCASQDWGRVDKIVVGNFVTASQAQRKWYTKVISKVSSGDYKLGAVSRQVTLKWIYLIFVFLHRIRQTSSCRTGLLVNLRKRRCKSMFALGFACCTKYVHSISWITDG